MEYWQLFENADLFVQRNMTPARIRLIRQSYALTQLKFAELIGVNYETYRKWEKGERYPSSPGCAILVFAEVSPQEFTKYKEKILLKIKNKKI